jgi:L,D-transpeptidase catalytic domain
LSRQTTKGGSYSDTPLLNETTLYKSGILVCGGSCEGKKVRGHENCEAFSGNGVRDYVITFLNDGDCYSIHGYPNTGDSHGCVRMTTTDITKLYNNLADTFTIEVVG